MTPLLDVLAPAKDAKAKPGDGDGAAMVCDFDTHHLGYCPAPTGLPGPLDVCRARIGGIGYRLGGRVVCFGCCQRAAREKN